MPLCTAVIGAGRMGCFVAGQLPKNTKKLIIDIDLQKARHLADRVGGIASDDLENAAEADLTAVVLPTAVVHQTVNRLLGILREGALILNMATTAHIDPALLAENRSVTVVDAKIIGHATSMSKGEPGIVVVDCDDAVRFDRIRGQLAGFFRVARGDASLVEQINTIASTEGIRAALTVKKKLTALEIDPAWIDVAVKTVLAGTIRSFVEDDLGHFARKLVEQLEKEV